MNGHIPQVIIELPQEEKELTLADIKRFMDTILARVDKNGLALQNLASKQDYIELNDQVTAQGMEIKQLKTEVKSLEKSVKDIEENFDRHIAEKINWTQQSADTRPESRPNNMMPNDINF